MRKKIQADMACSSCLIEWWIASELYPLYIT